MRKLLQLCKGFGMEEHLSVILTWKGWIKEADGFTHLH